VAENAREKPAFCRVTHVFAVRDQSARLRTAGKKRIVQNGLPAPPSASAPTMPRCNMSPHDGECAEY
jgi:hypothetical protein